MSTSLASRPVRVVRTYTRQVRDHTAAMQRLQDQYFAALKRAEAQYFGRCQSRVCCVVADRQVTWLVYKGRQASINAEEVRKMKADGYGPTEIAKVLKIGRASVYRVLSS